VSSADVYHCHRTLIIMSFLAFPVCSTMWSTKNSRVSSTATSIGFVRFGSNLKDFKFETCLSMNLLVIFRSLSAYVLLSCCIRQRVVISSNKLWTAVGWFDIHIDSLCGSIGENLGLSGTYTGSLIPPSVSLEKFFTCEKLEKRSAVSPFHLGEP
jgi:hypothetical protein